MQLDFNLYSTVLLFLGIAAGILSLFIIYRLDDIVRWFGLTLLSGSIWAFFYGLELASLDLRTMYFWIKVEYVGIVSIPVAWLLFCLKYTGKEKPLSNRFFVFGLFFISIATYISLLTTDSHNLYYKSLEIDSSGSFPLAAIEKGPWYMMYKIYFYFIILWGIYLLIANSKFSDPVFKRQTTLLVICTSIPLFVDVISIAGYRILGQMDVTPFAFIISFFVTGLGLVKFNLFGVVPIAKEQLIAAMTDGLVVIDNKDKIIEINPAMKHIINGAGIYFIGTHINKVFGKEADLLKLVKDRTATKKEVTEIFDQMDKTFLVEGIPLQGRNGRFKGTLLTFKDITEEKKNHKLLERQTAQLKKHNGVKDKLFSIISHDLKGPVLGVKEILDLSKRGHITTDDFAEILPALSDSMDGVTMLLENLLAWSRSQLKGEFMDRKVFDIHKLVQDQKSLMDPAASLKNIKLNIDSEGSIMVFADKNMVELVVRNLLNNAVKFCKTGDSVSVSIKNQEEDVKISVKDTGVGISVSNLHRLRSGDVFSTFGSNNESGTGLGLLLVRDYVEKNGGKLWIDSEENKWSEFTFALPKINVN